MNATNPLDHLVTARAHAESASLHVLLPFFDKFQLYYERKLWHQLSVEIEKFARMPEASSFLVDFYVNFVRDFEEKLNQLTLVADIGLQVSRLLPDNDSRISFLLSLADNIKKKAANSAGLPLTRRFSDSRTDTTERMRHNDEVLSAELLARTQAAHYQLENGQFEIVLQHVREAETTLNDLDFIDPRLSCVFYRVAADCYKAQCEFSKFYRISLLFLSALVSAKSEISNEESCVYAVDLCKAALLSDEIYNFGELLAHPFLDKIVGGPNEFLRTTIIAFNNGDIETFNKIKPKLLCLDNFLDKEAFLKQKICVMALIDYVFQRTARDRVLSFNEIATRLSVNVEDVEHFIMRALSLKLIRGTIEQITKQVIITWVMPRVMDRTQISNLANMVQRWGMQVQEKLHAFEMEVGDQIKSA